ARFPSACSSTDHTSSNAMGIRGWSERSSRRIQFRPTPPVLVRSEKREAAPGRVRFARGDARESIDRARGFRGDTAQRLGLEKLSARLTTLRCLVQWWRSLEFERSKHS